MEMDNISLPIYNANAVKLRSIFTVNDCIQVVFMTDLKTGKKLDDDYNVNEYLQAVIQANLLKVHGISDPEQVTSIVRSEEIDDDKTTIIIALDIVTNVQEGVDELRCSVSEEGFYSEVEEPITSEDSSLSWNQQVPDMPDSDPLAEHINPVAVPTLRWNSEMTTELIKIRGDMDREFAQAKFKFRLWGTVASKLNDMPWRLKVSAKDCDDKWRNIVATYRKNIDKIKTFGDNSVRWGYFDAMDNILKGTQELSMDITDGPNETMPRLMNTFSSFNFDINYDTINMSDDNSPVDELGIDEVDEPYQDCIITRKLNGEKRKWTTEQCLVLIYLRHQMEHRFCESYEKAPLHWNDLACQMNTYFLSNFSANELESTWNHCGIIYDINLENLKSKGVNTVNWKYFAVMDEIRGGTQEISDLCVPRPGENLLKEFQKLPERHSMFLPSQIDNIGVSTLTPLPVRDESDSEDTNHSPYPGIIWTQDMVKMLISLKKIIEQDILKHKIPRKKQWWTMVKRFRALKNVKVTEEACEEKWRNLVRTYKKNLARVRKRGTGVVRWSYFWKMHEVLGNVVIEQETVPRILYTDANSKSRVNETGSADITTINNKFIQCKASLEETIKEQRDHFSNLMNDFRDSQNSMLQEITDAQNKRIEELYQEQLNIKTLLTQLLQKFP